MSEHEMSDKAKKQPAPPEQSLLAAYTECGQHMRFYSDARFKIMTATLTLTTVLLSAQQIFPKIGIVFGLIGFAATMILFSLEYRYNQAWVTLLHWAEYNVEDKLFGKGGGPLNSYRDVRKPWYIIKSKPATGSLYFLLLLIWLGDIVFYIYKILV